MSTTYDQPVSSAMVADAVRGHAGASVDAVRRVNGFVGNQDFLVATSRGDFILKAMGAHSVVAESWACGRAREAGVPAPEIVAVDLDQAILPLPYLLMRRMPGGPVDEAHEAIVEVGRRLRALHEVRVEGFGLLTGDPEALGGPTPAAPRGRESSWSDVIARPLADLDDFVAGNMLDAALAERVRSTFAVNASLLTGPRGGVLLHGDLHPRHVFAAGDRLSGIIDWGDATAGDPAFEFGRYSRVGDASLDLLLRGYEPDDPALVRHTMVLYRVLWSLYAIGWEVRAGGDWVAGHVEAVREGLDVLGR